MGGKESILADGSKNGGKQANYIGGFRYNGNERQSEVVQDVESGKDWVESDQHGCIGHSHLVR